MSKSLPYSKIGYLGIGADGCAIDRYYAWNPLVGCSKGCPGCWARQVAGRFNFCAKCQAFTPHMHPERLDQPANTRKPGVVLCNFMAEAYDSAVMDGWRVNMSDAACLAARHVYVTLTQQYERWIKLDGQDPRRAPDNHFNGVTIRNQSQMDAVTAAGVWNLPCNLWINHEPADEPVDWTPAIEAKVKGIIIGDDRRRAAAPLTARAISAATCQFRRSGLNWYVKQAWVDGQLCKGDGLPFSFRDGARLPWSAPQAGRLLDGVEHNTREEGN